MKQQCAFTALRAELGQRPGLLSTAVLCATVAQVAGIPLALLTRRLVAEAANEGTSQDVLWFSGFALAALVLIQAATRWYGEIAAERLAQSVIGSLRVSMLHALNRKDPRDFDGRSSGKTLVRFIGDAGGLRAWITRAVVMTPADVLTIVGVTLALAWIQPQFMLAVAVPMALVPAVAIALHARIRDHTRAVRREQTNLAGQITEQLDDLSVVLATRTRDDSVGHIEPTIRAIEDGFVRRRKLDSLIKVAATAASGIAICALGVLGAQLIMEGQAQLADVMVAIWLSLMLRGPIRRLSTASSTHQRARVSGERIEKLLCALPAHEARNERYTGELQRVRWKNLGVRSADGGWVFRGLTGTATGPGCVSVIGTPEQRQVLFECTLGIRRPQEGRAGLDRVNVRKLQPDDVFRRIGWLDHDRAIVHRTLASDRRSWLTQHWDLTLEVAPDANLDQLLKSTEQADASSDLRLALTCAIAGDPSLILLDNPERGLNASGIERFRRWLTRTAHSRLVLVGVASPSDGLPATHTVDLRELCVAETQHAHNEPARATPDAYPDDDPAHTGPGVRAMAAAFVVIVLLPIVQNFREDPRDDFPLSYYPMFTSLRDGRTNVYHAIGIRADGSAVNLAYRLAGSGGMNQVRRQMRLLARNGSAAALAETVADNATRRGIVEKKELVAIEIVRDTYQFDEFFGGDRNSPSKRRRYHRLVLSPGEPK